MPRPDYKILNATPDILAKGRKYSMVPIIIGDVEDEVRGLLPASRRTVFADAIAAERLAGVGSQIAKRVVRSQCPRKCMTELHCAKTNRPFGIA